MPTTRGRGLQLKLSAKPTQASMLRSASCCHHSPRFSNSPGTSPKAKHGIGWPLLRRPRNPWTHNCLGARTARRMPTATCSGARSLPGGLAPTSPGRYWRLTRSRAISPAGSASGRSRRRPRPWTGRAMSCRSRSACGPAPGMRARKAPEESSITAIGLATARAVARSGCPNPNGGVIPRYQDREREVT
jgi:hypothetical protein